jgi:hypothetical protein
MDLHRRFAEAEMVAAHYEKFVDFARDGMAFLGFPCTWMQADIAEYMEQGPRLRMVMAQRGEAKSTLAALYAVWRIIHRHSTRVLVVSGGEKQASEVAILIIRIIMQWEILAYLHPDKTAGDRASVEAFDVHYALKGLDKSPSVACVGITANLPGKRADLLVADDIETTKNGMTATNRAMLMHISKEFSSICTHGDILYLGTPQTKDSVYNTLPGRGFLVRIWPGRYPTIEEVEKYGSKLAPAIAQCIQQDPSLQTGGGIDGTRGKPADPDRYTEDDLVEKELDKGPEDFSLQHMLDTSLADAERQQLKLSDLLVANFDPDLVPEILAYQTGEKNKAILPLMFPVPMSCMYHPIVPDKAQYVKPGERMMFIDPAGGGKDEIGYGVSTAVGPYIHALDVGGLKGGLTDANCTILCDLILDMRVNLVRVETNMGHGLFEKALQAELAKRANGYADPVSGRVHLPEPFFKAVGVVSEYSTGQKERRIIDSLVSAMQRHRIIVHRRVFESDERCGRQHSADKRNLYSLFHQLASITTDRNSLVQDDRLEAFAGSIRHWKDVLLLDENKAAQARALAASTEFMNNPMGYDEPSGPTAKGTRKRVHSRRSRRG